MWLLDNRDYQIAQIQPEVVPIVADLARVQLWPPALKEKRKRKAPLPRPEIAPPPTIDKPLLLAIADQYDVDGDDAESEDEHDAVMSDLLDKVDDVVGDSDRGDDSAGGLSDDEGAVGSEDPPPPVSSGSLCSVAVPGGHIAFYTKGDFEAVCSNACHRSGTTRCVLTRTKEAYKRSKVKRGGRPLGLMLVWLQKGCHGTRADHSSCVESITFAERVAARMAALAIPGFADLLNWERCDLEDFELAFEPLEV